MADPSKTSLLRENSPFFSDGSSDMELHEEKTKNGTLSDEARADLQE